MNIQWYPGHMTKTRRMIAENLKLIDAVCEIIDARIPVSSRNPDLDEITEKKPRLIVFNRVDQADPQQNNKWVNKLKNDGATVIETDCKSGKGIEKISQSIHKLLEEKLKGYAAKGQTGRRIRLMVAGIPNVGKSSFINRAAKKKAAQTSDKPGVTRGKQWINLSDSIELLDTPGILWPKFDDEAVAENLAFTGAIRDEVMDIEELGAKLMLRLKEFYPQSITERYKLQIPDNTDGYELLLQAAKNRGFILARAQYDTRRMAAVLLDEFRGGKLGRITLEKI